MRVPGGLRHAGWRGAARLSLPALFRSVRARCGLLSLFGYHGTLLRTSSQYLLLLSILKTHFVNTPRLKGIGGSILNASVLSANDHLNTIELKVISCHRENLFCNVTHSTCCQVSNSNSWSLDCSVLYQMKAIHPLLDSHPTFGSILFAQTNSHVRICLTR